MTLAKHIFISTRFLHIFAELARNLGFKLAQDCFRGEDFSNLKSNHHLAKYCPFRDELGLIRARSRLDRSDLLHVEVQLPMILSTNHPITFLFVQNIHHLFQHPVGTNAMKAEIGKHCLIPGVYKLERKARRSCVRCQKKSAQPQIPMMASLPSYRYSESLRAFSSVGIDFTGSFEIKQLKTTRSARERPKAYVLVISCLQTRV